MVRLTSIYEQQGVAKLEAIQDLWNMLSERTPVQSISHKAMPEYHQHVAFVNSQPYAVWYLILAHHRREFGADLEQRVVGNMYLTHQREVGIHIMNAHRGSGYGAQALQMLRARHPGRLLANINPQNQPSIDFFTRHGGRPLQITLELP